MYNKLITRYIKITNSSSDYIDIVNTIIWKSRKLLVNLSSNEHGVNVLYSSDLLNWGEQNMDSNPIFIDPHNNNYQLSDFSPAIGSGQLEKH